MVGALHELLKEDCFWEVCSVTTAGSPGDKVLTLVFELKRKFLVNSGNPGYTEHSRFLKALK